MECKRTSLPGVKESRRALNFEYACRKGGLMLLVIIILAALAGLFSVGYFSSSEKTTSAHSVKLEYERFGRLQTEFTVKITAPVHSSGQYIFRLGGDFNRRFETGNIWPQPDRMYSRDGALYLAYDAAPHPVDFSVWLKITPTKPGKAVSTLWVNGGPAIRFWQFIYP
jgi:hypothetical protein